MLKNGVYQAEGQRVPTCSSPSPSAYPRPAPHFEQISTQASSSCLALSRLLSLFPLSHLQLGQLQSVTFWFCTGCCIWKQLMLWHQFILLPSGLLRGRGVWQISSVTHTSKCSNCNRCKLYFLCHSQLLNGVYSGFCGSWKTFFFPCDLYVSCLDAETHGAAGISHRREKGTANDSSRALNSDLLQGVDECMPQPWDQLNQLGTVLLV